MAPPPPKKTSKALVIILVILGVCGMCCVVSLGVAYPAFTRYMRRAKSIEAVDRLAYLFRSSGTYVASLGAAIPVQPAQFPAPAAMTPSSVPRGARVVDAAGTWDTPTWQALAFSMRDPHYYAYQYLSSGQGSGAQFTARALGDLDGDGECSTFERSGGLNGTLELQGSTGVWMRHEDE